MTKTSATPKAVKNSANKSVQKKLKKASTVAVKRSTKQAAKEAAKVAKPAAEKRTTRYIPKAIPAGKIVCHNGAMPETPIQPPGMNSFRVWLDDEAKSDEYGPCNCGWGGLPHHMPLGWLESLPEYDARKFPRK